MFELRTRRIRPVSSSEAAGDETKMGQKEEEEEDSRIPIAEDVDIGELVRLVCTGVCYTYSIFSLSLSLFFLHSPITD